MKIFNFFKKKNKSVVIDGKNIIINNVCINKVFSEYISRLDEAIKKQDLKSVADVKSGLEKILKELECDFYDDNNCEINQKNTSFFNFGGNVTQQISSVTTSNGKNKVKVKQTSFFNKGNTAGGNITIQQSNINGDNVFKGD